MGGKREMNNDPPGFSDRMKEITPGGGSSGTHLRALRAMPSAGGAPVRDRPGDRGRRATPPATWARETGAQPRQLNYYTNTASPPGGN